LRAQMDVVQARQVSRIDPWSCNHIECSAFLNKSL
jgi:hypothetical protein